MLDAILLSVWLHPIVVYSLHYILNNKLNVIQISRIQETKNLSTDADSSTAAKKLLSIFLFFFTPPRHCRRRHRKGLLGKKKNNNNNNNLNYPPTPPRGVLSLVVKEGWPIRGLELIMWPEGHWEASKNITGKGDIRQIDIVTLWKNRPGQILWKGVNATSPILRPKSV